MMAHLNIIKKHGGRIIAPLLIVWLVLQIMASCGQLTAGWLTTHRALDQIERRISLDQAYIDIGNSALGTPVNQAAVERYINRINSTLAQIGSPARIRQLQNISADTVPAAYSDAHQLTLLTSEQTLTIDAVARPLTAYLSFSMPALAFFIALIPIRIYTYRRRRQRARHQADLAMPAEPTLVINLNEKTLGNGVDDTKVTLQNKPLCFYAALLQYCIENPGAPLQHHKQVPDELLERANRVFSRLIELGHTKRKRPDFNANLDKTLSEIRAALDEVFFAYNEHKELYYPPRAQGEGSRSRQHSYALPAIEPIDVEIIGN